MTKDNRDLEIEAIDKRIAAIQDDKEQIKKYAEVAKALEVMCATDEYKLVIEQVFLKEETENMMDLLSGDSQLQDSDVEGINKILSVVRGFKSFIKNTKELGDDVQDRLSICDARIAEEKVYRDEVFKNEGELDG